MRLRAAAVVALLLLAAAVAMLFAGGEIRLGSPASRDLGGWPTDVAVLATLAALGIGIASPATRLPLASAVLGTSGALVAGGASRLLRFYDGSALMATLGVACVVACWLALAGRAERPGWTRDARLRALAYLTLGLILVPGAFVAVALVSCARSDDELCALPGLAFGAPAALVAWLAFVVAAETRVRRRSQDAKSR